jgi:acetolactate synthase small subunit
VKFENVIHREKITAFVSLLKNNKKKEKNNVIQFFTFMGVDIGVIDTICWMC